MKIEVYTFRRIRVIADYMKKATPLNLNSIQFLNSQTRQFFCRFHEISTILLQVT